MTMTDALRGGTMTVLEGRDGWLFLATFESTDVLRMYTDPECIASGVLDDWVSAIRRRSAALEKRDILSLALVAPDTHLVYPDKLPEGIKLSPSSPFDRLAGRFDPTELEDWVYPLAELKAGRDSEETYQSVDSHWTDWGAWLAYQQTMQRLRPRLPSIRVLDEQDIVWSVRSTFGALGPLMRPERSARVPIANLREPRASRIQQVTTEVRESYMVMEQDAPDLPTALIFRDSFMTAQAKLFAESFRRAVFVSAKANAIFYDLVDLERPDVVIHEMGERTLIVAPREPAPDDFRATYGDLILDDPEAVSSQRRSRSLLRAGQFAESLAANDEALSRVPPTARLLVHRARVYSSLGRLDGALESLRHAASLDPDDAGVWFWLAQVLWSNDHRVEAREAARRAVTLEPEQESYWPTAVAFAVYTRELDLATMLIDVWRATHPESASLLFAQSLLCTGRLDKESALVAAERALELEPSSVFYARHVASLLVQLDDARRADDRLAALALAYPDDPDIRSMSERVATQGRMSEP
jgi:tetratricopeptide (TPR) repeat protein